MRPALRLLTALALASAPMLGAQEVPFKIVVQESLPGTSMKRSMAADIYLKKITRWGDGVAINPVDQSTASAVRISFSQRVLGKPVAGVQIYWMRQMSSPGGATPPPVKASDAEVIAFVESKRGAIGYVSEAAALPETLKVLELTE